MNGCGAAAQVPIHRVPPLRSVAEASIGTASVRRKSRGATVPARPDFCTESMEKRLTTTSEQAGWRDTRGRLEILQAGAASAALAHRELRRHRVGAGRGDDRRFAPWLASPRGTRGGTGTPRALQSMSNASRCRLVSSRFALTIQCAVARRYHGGRASYSFRARAFASSAFLISEGSSAVLRCS